MKCHVCNTNYESVKEGVFSCPNCKHIYREYNNDIIKYHEKLFRKDHRRDNKEFNSKGEVTPLFHEKREKIVSDRLSNIAEFLDPGFTCLDVGGGAGTFANKIKSKIKSIELQELSLPLIRECKRLGFKTYLENIRDLKNQYDLVFAWHVLEHVENIQDFIKTISKLTKKMFIMEIPINRRIPKKFDGHLHYFSEGSLLKLLKPYFKVLKVNGGSQRPALFAACERI